MGVVVVVVWKGNEMEMKTKEKPLIEGAFMRGRYKWFNELQVKQAVQKAKEMFEEYMESDLFFKSDRMGGFVSCNKDIIDKKEEINKECFGFEGEVSK